LRSLPEVEENLDSHVGSDAKANHEGQGSRGLGHRFDGVDKGVHDSRDGERPEKGGGERHAGVGLQVQERDEQEGGDVLQIIQVRSAKSNKIFIKKIIKIIVVNSEFLQ